MGLDVYLSGRRIGALSPDGEGGYSFAYATELVEKVANAGAQGAQLSRSLPVRPEPYAHAETSAYVEGLLPEGPLRETIARELCVDPTDGYALIAELGRDCPGAVVFLPEGQVPEPREAGSLAWLGRDELEQLMTTPERGLIDPAQPERMRFTLPGERHKLALVHDETRNRWAWPEAGVPSTHIVKPEVGGQPDFAVNAMACTTALRIMGLPVAHTELKTIAGRRCLVSRRFDRWGEAAGAERLHQESFCQALGLPPEGDAVERCGYPQSCELLREIGEEDSIETLFAVAFCNHLFGSGDASVHGKSSALLYTAGGPLLAPYPDVASTAVYESSRARPSIFGLVRRDSNLPELAPSAVGCDFEFQPSVVRGLETAAGLTEALKSVAGQAREEGWYARLIDRIPPRASPHVFWLEDEDGLFEL